MMELELRYDKELASGLRMGGHQLFLDGKSMRFFFADAEIKAKHWIATEIEKLIGLDKSVRITVEGWQP